MMKSAQGLVGGRLFTVFQRHDTAKVADDSHSPPIGEGTKIWGFASVEKGVSIGCNCVIGMYVHVGPHVVIGHGCKIQNGAQLFEGVTLEDDVFIGPHAVFTNVKVPRAHVSRKAEFKPTLVKRGASIGANATILCGITIGEYALVGAGSVVTEDVAAHALVYGNPAKPHGAVCKCGERLVEKRYDRRATYVRVDFEKCTCGAEYEFVLDRGEASEIRAKASTP